MENRTPQLLMMDSAVLVTESDLDGYDATCAFGVVGNDMLREPSLACKVQFASQAAISRLSCLWLGYQPGQKSSTKKLRSSIRASQLSSITVDIRFESLVQSGGHEEEYSIPLWSQVPFLVWSLNAGSRL
ncbi:dual specificity protein phosphatase DSP8 [Populus alba x Populus x berolinensis]|uniref:Dual specificity protein phosphatase DSP8 n=1 Tax=Populus alba x Populus x berolinensis TaxID=444605 RepID=A0AAD6LRA8_9ROSI|nr:dual specificity protein phosphatase DSP8 [Populus alba x Populus x berolinensis]